MVASIKIELYDCKDDLDIEKVGTALRTFLENFEGTEEAKGKIVVKIPGFEYWVKIEERES